MTSIIFKTNKKYDKLMGEFDQEYEIPAFLRKRDDSDKKMECMDNSSDSFPDPIISDVVITQDEKNFIRY